jgi:CelD/BcsL family acetyltransferase involved in cellulose biosynthesis
MRRDGRLVGVLPLYRQRGALRTTTNWHTPEFAILAEDAHMVRELARAALLSTPRRLAIAFIESDTEAFRHCLAAARAARYRTLVRTLVRSLYVDIVGDWTTFQERIDRKVARDLRRRRRRLGEEGDVSVQVFNGRDHLDDLLQEGFRVEASGWKRSQGASIAARPETQRLWSEIARWAADRGSLRLGYLREGPLVGDRLSASPYR